MGPDTISRAFGYGATLNDAIDDWKESLAHLMESNPYGAVIVNHVNEHLLSDGADRAQVVKDFGGNSGRGNPPEHPCHHYHPLTVIELYKHIAIPAPNAFPSALRTALQGCFFRVGSVSLSPW